jgi:hypothetical protein
VVASPDGSSVYALTQDSLGAVAVVGISTASNIVIFAHSIPGSHGGFTNLPHMPAPAVSADGQTLYIATSSLTVFDVSTQTVTATIQTPYGYTGLVGLAVTPDDPQAIVTGNTDIDGRGQLALVDLQKQAVVKLIQFSQNEFIGPVAMSPSGSQAYILSNQRNPGQNAGQGL